MNQHQRIIFLEVRAQGGDHRRQEKGMPGRKPELIKIYAVEHLDDEGRVWDRRVTEFNGNRVNDKHEGAGALTTTGASSVFYRKGQDPMKFTTNKNKARMCERQGRAG